MGGRRVVVAFGASAALGLIIWFFTGSAFVSSLAAVIAMAAAIAALFVTSSTQSGLSRARSNISISQSKNVKVTGIALRQKPKRIDSKMRLRKVDDGEVSGVRED
jgi:hypothetical protein